MQDLATRSTPEAFMALRFIGIDPDTGTANSPTVWVDEERAELVLQGWKATEELLAQVEAVGSIPGHDTKVPDHEAVIRIPARMVPALREACDAAERLTEL
ncbi:hypothetical protein ABIA33_006554 [Streptacidiphilus sp. MAP12-16]